MSPTLPIGYFPFQLNETPTFQFFQEPKKDLLKEIKLILTEAKTRVETFLYDAFKTKD